MEKKIWTVFCLIIHTFGYGQESTENHGVYFQYMGSDTALLECKEYEWSEQNIGESIEQNIKHLQEQAKKASE